MILSFALIYASIFITYMFQESTRKCGFCHAIGSDMMTCSRCKVYAYCNKACQASHWSSAHKKICKPLIPPPTEKETSIPRGTNDDADLDSEYKYIVISPQEEASLHGLHNTTRGVTESSCLDKLVACGSVDDLQAEPDVLAELREKYGLGPGISTCIVPGHSYDFDGRHQVLAYYTDGYSTGSSGSSVRAENAIAASVLMKRTDEVRGNVVLAVLKRIPLHTEPPSQLVSPALSPAPTSMRSDLDGKGEQQLVSAAGDDGTEASATVRQEAHPVSRRGIIDLGIHNSSCGGAGCVSRRVHFENMRRKEVLADFKRQGYQVFDGKV